MARVIHDDRSPNAIRTELAHLRARVKALEARVAELSRQHAQLNDRRVDVREVVDATE